MLKLHFHCASYYWCAIVNAKFTHIGASPNNICLVGSKMHKAKKQAWVHGFATHLNHQPELYVDPKKGGGLLPENSKHASADWFQTLNPKP
jgi:hypothetical protein